MALSGVLYSSAWHSTAQGDDVRLKFSWTAVQSVAGNYSDISWELRGDRKSSYRAQAGNFQVIIGGEIVYETGHDDRIGLNSETVVASGTYRAYHYDDGHRSFSVKIAGAIYVYSRNVSGNAVFDLNDIPRKAVLSSAPNFNDEENPTIKYSNPAGAAASSLTASIEFAGQSISRTLSVTGSQYTFDFTSAEREKLRAACTYQSMQVVYKLKTTIGGTVYTDEQYRTMSMVNAEPVVTASAVTDSSTQGYTGKSNVVIAGWSDVVASISATPRKGATIIEYRITHDDQPLYVSSNTYSGVTSGEFSFTVIDSRRFEVKKTVNLTILPYFKPSCDLTASATIDEQNNATFHLGITGSVFNKTFGATVNTWAIEYRYRKRGGDWSGYVRIPNSKITVSGDSLSASVDVLGLDYQSTYEFQAHVADELSEGISGVFPAKALPIFEISQDLVKFNVPVIMPESSVSIDNAGSHNSTYRGKKFVGSPTAEQYAAIKAGTFKDLFIGDYWEINGVNWRIAGFDYFLKTGDSQCLKHHAVIVPDSALDSGPMNDTATTAGGYVGSKMRMTGLERTKSIIRSVFPGHVLKIRLFLVNAVGNGLPSGRIWVDSEADLMTERMVYGNGVFSPVSDQSLIPANQYLEKSQLPLFSHRADLISNRVWFWLQDSIVSDSFANVDNAGFSNKVGASFTGGGVRPFFCIYGGA